MNRSFIDIDNSEQVDKYIDEICSDPIFLCDNKELCGKKTTIYSSIQNVEEICKDISETNVCENDFKECESIIKNLNEISLKKEGNSNFIVYNFEENYIIRNKLNN